MLELAIDSIRVSLMNYQRVVILKEKEAERYLPIWIGPAEADAIAVKLQDVAVPRPLTHDLLCSFLETLGVTVNCIVVSDLFEDTFYAKILLNANGSIVEVDARPSDAIALAVRTRTPIYAEEAVLEKAGVTLDKETKKPLIADRQEGITGEVGEEELRRMSAFTDFIQSLDMSDFDQESKTSDNE